MKLTHVGVNVSDLKKSEDFYERVLGCRKTGRIENERVEICFLDFDNSSFELVYNKISGDKPANNGHLHFAFDSDDVDADFKRIKSLGVRTKTEAPVDFEGGRLFFFFGPDGETFEFCGGVNITPV